MPTDDDPPADLAATALGLTEGDTFILSLATGDALAGTVDAATSDPPGEHLDTPGRYHIEFQASGVAFELTIHYHAGDRPETESADLQLVEGYDWSIPIEAAIESLEQR